MDPVDWQTRYHNHDTPWDKGRCHPLTSLALTHFSNGNILVPGCGRGWDAAALRDLTSPPTQIIGVDLSEIAIRDARTLHGSERITWHHADLFLPDTQAAWPSTANIWEHTCLCALPLSLRDNYVRTMAQLLPTNGIYCGIFFTHMDDGGSGPPWNTSLADLGNLFRPYFQIIHYEKALETFPGRENEESFIVMQRNDQPVSP